MEKSLPPSLLPVNPGIEVIVLGSSGGPIDKQNSAYLVKSTSTKLSDKGSLLAIDAGCLLAGILSIMESEAQEKADARIFPLDELPYSKITANAHHIITESLSGICLTHQHMDHIAGLVLNSVCFSPESPKTVAALPNCIDGLVQHIFNGSIWPNLTNESIDRYGHRTVLKDGYSIYLERLNEIKVHPQMAKGLSVAAYPVSHGNHQVCDEKSCPRSAAATTTSHHSSATTTSHHSSSPLQLTLLSSPSSPSSFVSTSPSSFASCSTNTSSYSDASSSVTVRHASSYDSAAFFIQETENSSVIIVFGDVEADSISSNPRNRAVWKDAASLLDRRLLKGIFIECSYTNSRPDELLYGHLKPKYLIEELAYLGSCTTTNHSLQSLKVIITHIKFELSNHEPPHEQILKELKTLAQESNLQCSFELAFPGQHLYF